MDGMISKLIGAIVGIIVLVTVVAALYPTGTTAGTTLNTSGFPLATLFTAGGAVWVIIAAAMVLGVLAAVWVKYKK